MLLEISRVDDVLRRGLCGATRARPLAMHLIAGDPAVRLDDELAVTLLRRAVAEDPGSGLATAALLGQRSLQIEQQADVAGEADATLERIDGHGAGWAAMRLRLTYMLAATRFNIVLQRAQAEPASPAGVHTATLGAVHAAMSLVRLLRSRSQEAAQLRRQVRVIAGYLVLDVNTRVAEDVDVDGWRDTVEQAERWVRPTRTSDSVRLPPPLNAAESYARACYECSRRADGDWAERALADVRVAATDPQLRRWARDDPSLEPLRREPEQPGDTVAARLQQIVGEPGVAAFFDLTAFDARRDVIRSLGLAGPRDLVELSDEERARLDVPGVVLQRWNRIAELALPAGDQRAVPIDVLDVLLRLGVHSRADLAGRLADDLDAWHARVLAAGRDLAVRPARADWHAYAHSSSG